MPIELKCDSCGARYKVNERFAGKKAKCRQCGALMQVPGTPVSWSGSSPMLESPIIDRPTPMPRPLSPQPPEGLSPQRPMPVPKPTPRPSAPGEPLILSSNAAEYVHSGEPRRKHWSRHLPLWVWIVIAAAALLLAVLGLILLFDPAFFFPTSLPAK
ncbi:MAG TPA: hypothetical protein VMD30_00980 [Tepidisphaeraceae bacterium]|nr:hypothetical protein [Tepidisphaeraceae bacterium]